MRKVNNSNESSNYYIVYLDYYKDDEWMGSIGLPKHFDEYDEELINAYAKEEIEDELNKRIIKDHDVRVNIRSCKKLR